MPYEEGIARIYSSNYDIDAQNFMGVVYAYVDSYGYSALLEFVEQQIKSSGGTDDDVSKKHKEIALARKRIESLGISVASVHDMPMMKGISTLLDDELKTRAKPRKKHKFSEINSVKEPSGGIRYMCKPTIHSEKGEFKRTTIASSVGGSRVE